MAHKVRITREAEADLRTIGDYMLRNMRLRLPAGSFNRYADALSRSKHFRKGMA
jgi:hypothetical protein